MPPYSQSGAVPVKIKSALITSASGSIGGLTASHNRGGLYLRARTIPTNPNSPQQQVVRAFVASLTSAWLNTLTELQRMAWDGYALLVPLPDPLGEPRNVGGLQMFIRSNVPRLQAGLDLAADAPTVFNLAEFHGISVGTFAAATNDFAVTFDNTRLWAGEDGGAILVLGSRPQNPSVNYFKGPYQFAGLIEGDAITPPTSPATIVNPFPFAVDSRVFVQMRVTRADGRLSLPFRDFGLGA